MKTRLLRKLRKRARNIYYIGLKNGRIYYVYSFESDNRIYRDYRPITEYDLGIAKKYIKRSRINYILRCVRVLKYKKAIRKTNKTI